MRRYLEIIKPYASAPQQQLLNHGWIIGGEFPPPLWRGWGALAGLLLGLLFAWLLLCNTLIIPNVEGLFSLGPFTFYTL